MVRPAHWCSASMPWSSTTRTRGATDRKSTRLNSSPPCNLVCRLLLEKKKKIDRRAGGPRPRHALHALIGAREQVVTTAEALAGPCVLDPVDLGHGVHCVRGCCEHYA